MKATIQTERLEIVALTVTQLRLWTEDIAMFENEIACTYRAEPMVGMFLKVVKGQIAICEKHPEHYMWHSFWLLIRKSDRVVVGSADFKGLPNDNGEVEIGYGLGKEYEHNGYMTEAVAAMTKWALSNGAAQVIAETDADGYASQRVLKRCGFVSMPQRDGCWWQFDKSTLESHDCE